jgi:hypothetical protein
VFGDDGVIEGAEHLDGDDNLDVRVFRLIEVMTFL